jgi:hypothetical protein
MGRKVKQLKNYTTEQVERLFDSDENNIAGVKLYAIIQLTRGYSTRKPEEFYRVTHKQICNRADRFDAEGVDGLRMKPGRGRRSLISEEQKERLKTDLSQSPEIFGYNTANRSDLCCADIWKSPIRYFTSRQLFMRFYTNLAFIFNVHAGNIPKETKSSVRQPKQI